MADESSILLDEAAYKNKKVEWEKSNAEHLGLETNTNSASHHPWIFTEVVYHMEYPVMFGITERINVAKQVEDFKKKIPSHLAVSTKRSKVTQFIAVKKIQTRIQTITW